MSRIKIDLHSATTEQIACQILTILRENATKKPPSGYFPGCLESVLQFEFAPVEMGLNVKGGVLIQPGGAVSSYGGDRGSDKLRTRFHDAAHLLRQRGYIARRHDQSNDNVVKVTAEGDVVDIDRDKMMFAACKN